MAHRCGQRSPTDPHVKHKDENRVEDDVEDGTRSDANHAETGVALQSHLVVKRQRRHHERCGKEDEPQVVVGVGEDALGGAHRPRQGRDENHADEACNGAQNQRGEEPRGSHAPRVLSLFGTQGTRDVVARAMPEKESASINKGHVGKGDAHACHGFGAQMSHIERVHHIVDGGYEHADDGRHSHLEDQPPDGLLRHHLIPLVDFPLVVNVGHNDRIRVQR